MFVWVTDLVLEHFTNTIFQKLFLCVWEVFNNMLKDIWKLVLSTSFWGKYHPPPQKNTDFWFWGRKLVLLTWLPPPTRETLLQPSGCQFPSHWNLSLSGMVFMLPQIITPLAIRAFFSFWPQCSGWYLKSLLQTRWDSWRLALKPTCWPRAT